MQPRGRFLTTSSDVTVTAEALERVLVRLFGASGMPTTNAQYCPHVLVLTTLWGIDSHGVLRARLSPGREPVGRPGRLALLVSLRSDTR
jgi:hypothetical protein